MTTHDSHKRVNRAVGLIAACLAISHAFCLGGPTCRAADKPGVTAKREVPWDTTALFRRPRIYATKERPANGMKAFFYEGAKYKGKTTWVFAYYAAPTGTPPRGGWPAVVCAQG